jgi:hypothetical protein
MEAVLIALLMSVITSLGVTGPAERVAEKAVRARLGKVQEVKVRIDRGHRSPFSRTVPEIEITVKGFKMAGEPAETLHISGGEKLGGKIGRVTIRAEDFEVEGLKVERMDATIRSIRYDLLRALWRRRLRLTGVGESTIAVRLRGRDLQPYLAKRVTALDAFQLRLLHGRVEVTGKAKTLIPLPVRLVAGLEVKNRDEIHLASPTIHVSALPLPGFLVKRIMSQVNPVVDLLREKDPVFAMEIERLLVGPSGISATGRIRPAPSLAGFPGKAGQAPPR